MNSYQVRKNIQDRMAELIAKETGAIVEVTNTSATEWTISGSGSAPSEAANFLIGTGRMAIKDSVYDEELEELFIYLVTK